MAAFSHIFVWCPTLARFPLHMVIWGEANRNLPGPLGKDTDLRSQLYISVFMSFVSIGYAFSTIDALPKGRVAGGMGSPEPRPQWSVLKLEKDTLTFTVIKRGRGTANMFQSPLCTEMLQVGNEGSLVTFNVVWLAYLYIWGIALCRQRG